MMAELAVMPITVSQFLLLEFIKNVDCSIIVTDHYKQPLFWRNVGIPETANYYEISTEEQQKLAPAD